MGECGSWVSQYRKTKRNKYRGILFSVEHIFVPKLISNDLFENKVAEKLKVS